MLSRILNELRNSSNVIDLDGLSERLGVERSALDGMLETLVRQGKLKEMCAAGPPVSVTAWAPAADVNYVLLVVQ